MKKLRDGIIFYSDFSPLDFQELTLEEIKEKYCSQITRHTCFDAFSAEKKGKLENFVLNCIHLAFTSHSEIYFDFQKECRTLSAIMYSSMFVFLQSEIADFCDICHCATDLFILPPVEDSKKISISVNFDL
jgi:hypothetical protein